MFAGKQKLCPDPAEPSGKGIAVVCPEPTDGKPFFIKGVNSKLVTRVIMKTKQFDK
jgi:hypothetical protein